MRLVRSLALLAAGAVIGWVGLTVYILIGAHHGID